MKVKTFIKAAISSILFMIALIVFSIVNELYPLVTGTLLFILIFLLILFGFYIKYEHDEVKK